jgi:hypothetical protein
LRGASFTAAAGAYMDAEAGLRPPRRRAVMKTRKLGSPRLAFGALEVSTIGFGCMGLNYM